MPPQVSPAFRVRCPWKLVEDRKVADRVRRGDVLQVCMKCGRVAGDVHDAIKVLQQLHGLLVQPCRMLLIIPQRPPQMKERLRILVQKSSFTI